MSCRMHATPHQNAAAGEAVERAAPTHVLPSGESDPLNVPLLSRCAMHIFRCYFLNAADRIEAFEVIEVASLGEGIDRALAMLKARPQHRNVELWDGSRRVYPTRYGDVLPRQRSSS